MPRILSKVSSIFSSLLGARSSTRKNAALMASGTLASRILGLVRIVALAYALGSHSLADVFNLANNAPNTIYDLILGGVISSTLLPVFASRLAKSDTRMAWMSISAVLTLSGIFLVIATVLFELAAPGIIGLYTSLNHSAQASEQRRAATELLRFFAPQLLFYGVITLITAVLNAKRNFAAPAFAPILNNIVAIITLLIFASMYHHPSVSYVLSNPRAIRLLGIGTTLGVAFQAISLIPMLKRVGARIRFRVDFRDHTVREVFQLSGWTFAAVVANQLALVIVLAIADRRPGEVTAYNYAYLFFQLPYAIAALSIMSTIQPELAERYQGADLSGFANRFNVGLRSSVAVVLPAAAAFLSFGPTLIFLALGHGRAAAQGTQEIGSALLGFAFGVPGFAAFLAMTQGFQAIKDTKSVFYLYLVENGLNVILAVALQPILGVKGLAMSLAIAYTIAAIVGWWMLKAKAIPLSLKPYRRVWTRSLLGSVAFYLVGNYSISHLRGGGFIYQSVVLLISLILGVAAFFAVAEATARITNLRIGGQNWRR
ncbi:MAG: murein biosynthesis integral membrane protein MurJ [Acidimicrobiaceae bacterium]|nr:murein biosynthesis integral membrane protein MurJ [Acidimicrobiaceae bacterium]